MTQIRRMTLPFAYGGLQVDHQFEVRGVGSVLSGTLVGGCIRVGQRLLLGPTPEGLFSSVAVTCIQRSQARALPARWAQVKFPRVRVDVPGSGRPVIKSRRVCRTLASHAQIMSFPIIRISLPSMYEIALLSFSST